MWSDFWWSGFAAIGTWVAGIGTISAVTVALRSQRPRGVVTAIARSRTVDGEEIWIGGKGSQLLPGETLVNREMDLNLYFTNRGVYPISVDSPVLRINERKYDFPKGQHRICAPGEGIWWSAKIDIVKYGAPIQISACHLRDKRLLYFSLDRRRKRHLNRELRRYFRSVTIAPPS